MNTFQLSPAVLGFIKAIGVIILVSVLSYLGNAANLTGVINNPVIISVIVALASAWESKLKAQTGNSVALFGTVGVKRV